MDKIKEKLIKRIKKEIRDNKFWTYLVFDKYDNNNFFIELNLNKLNTMAS